DALEASSGTDDRTMDYGRRKLLTGLSLALLVVTAGTLRRHGTRGGEALLLEPRTWGRSQQSHHSLNFTGLQPRVCLEENSPWLPEACFTLPGYTSEHPHEPVITFDLSDELELRNRRYLVAPLIRNARIFTEPKWGVRYWSPVDD